MQPIEKTYNTTKEFLYALRFPTDDVIQSEQDKKARCFQLIRAMRLGNLFKNKVRISFRDSQDRLMKINTTIWGVTKESVILKKGVYIPIRSIVSVD